MNPPLNFLPKLLTNLKLIFVLDILLASKIEEIANLIPDTRGTSTNVKGKIVRKKGETEYSNENGEGTYFWAIVKDATDQCKIIGYNDIVRKFADKFEASQVVNFRQCPFK